jgi:phosphopantothenoylcysteine synthetase/decarboxylase
LTVSRIVYLIAAAAPPVLQIAEACRRITAEDWRPCVILTPTAATWVSIDELSALTEWPVRVNPRLPHEQDSLPDADAVIAAPLTFNTINKWAAGISDTLALGLLNELMGAGLPIYVAPCVKSALRNHPAYSASTTLLRKSGVTVLDQDKVAFKAQTGLIEFDWSSIAAALC